MTDPIEEKYKCDFCERECTFRIIPPDEVAIRHNLPISYSNLGPSGDLNRCVKCGKICCQPCFQDKGWRCPHCGSKDSELPFQNKFFKSVMASEKTVMASNQTKGHQ
jgi:DNA-directed RNA polymerase subunit RPC12/RpoP